ncbi:1537_t:CDS:2, partial [Cetraspora pellucida]
MPSDKYNSRSRFNKSTRRNRCLVRTSQSVACVNTSPVRPPSPPTAEEQMIHEGFAFNSCQASHDSAEMCCREKRTSELSLEKQYFEKLDFRKLRNIKEG